MNWYVEAFRKFGQFEGRSRRLEYWMFLLFHVLIIIALGIVENLFHTKGTLAGLYSLAALIPGLALSVRRLHDVNKSGGYIFINLIPIVGIIWYLVLVCSEGTHGMNKYGPPQKIV